MGVKPYKVAKTGAMEKEGYGKQKRYKKMREIII